MPHTFFYQLFTPNRHMFKNIIGKKVLIVSLIDGQRHTAIIRKREHNPAYFVAEHIGTKQHRRETIHKMDILAIL